MQRPDRAAHAWRTALAQLVDRSFNRAARSTPDAPHVRSRWNSDAIHNGFLLASLPAFAIGAWASGAGLAASAAQTDNAAGDWQSRLAVALNLSGDQVHWLGELGLGLACILPLLFVAAAVSAFWELAFAVLRQRPVDSGGPMLAWLFVLLLPLKTPLLMVALGISFGAVIGKHIFGGSGRYLVSPALLGVLFLWFAYPSVFNAPGSPSLPSWSLLAAGTGGQQSGLWAWLAVFLGREAGAIGAPSTLACMAGAIYLAGRGAISARTIGGAVLGLIVTAVLFASLGGTGDLLAFGWHWHLALGYFAFAIAFVATDPSIMPLTPAGRWLYGALLGALTITIRVASPEHPEGSLIAVLLASLCIPLIDDVVMRLKLRALHARRLERQRG
jgi:Na+-transporting NADH:ubiquinone oxidoreductase subunit B